MNTTIEQLKIAIQSVLHTVRMGLSRKAESPDWQENDAASLSHIKGRTGGYMKDGEPVKFPDKYIREPSINNLVAGANVTFTKNDSTGEITVAAKDTTYRTATSTMDGLMPKYTVEKLDKALSQYRMIISGHKKDVVPGRAATAEGDNTTSTGNSSHAEGYYTTASGDSSHAEGHGTKATGAYGSHAEGEGTTASGLRSHAEGYYTTASGDSSHAEGYYTTASGDSSHAEGSDTTASASYSHAEGSDTTASASCSHAEGSDTEASGGFSHAEGRSTTASGNYSHAEGWRTKAATNCQHAQGRYNIECDDTIAHVVGNGDSSAGVYSNAHTLAWDGTAWYQGDVYVGSTSGTNKDEGSKKLATEDFVNQLLNDPLPAFTAADNGKVLGIVDGALAWVDKGGVVEEVLFDDTVTIGYSEINGHFVNLENNTPFVAGQMYKVILDGVTYYLTAKERTDSAGAVIVGNQSIWIYDAENTGEPFMIQSNGTAWSVVTDGTITDSQALKVYLLITT